MNTKFLKLFCNLVLVFKFSDGVFYEAPYGVHGAVEFMDINVVKGCSV